MPEITLASVHPISAEESAFDAIRRYRDDGSVYWTARDLQPYLGYDAWQNFKRPLADARKAAEIVSAGQHHFVDSTKMVKIGSDASRSIADVELTRYGAYMVTLACDGRKPEVAAAKTYFAAQTYFAEQAQHGSTPGTLDNAAASLITDGQSGAEPAAPETSLPTGLGERFDTVLKEFQRTVTPATLESPAAGSLAAALHVLSFAMAFPTGTTKTPLAPSLPEGTPDALTSTPAPKSSAAPKSPPAPKSPAASKSPAVPKSSAGLIPDELEPFVSQEGVSKKYSYPTRTSVPISEEADTPATYPEFAELAGVEPCGRCGQALSHRMTALAEEKGVPTGRRGPRNVFPLDFWIESWEKLSPHLERLHRDHSRGHH